MAVDFATFSNIVHHVTNVRKPVLLRGRHGIGKLLSFTRCCQANMKVVTSCIPDDRG